MDTPAPTRESIVDAKGAGKPVVLDIDLAVRVDRQLSKLQGPYRGRDILKHATGLKRVVDFHELVTVGRYRPARRGVNKREKPGAETVVCAFTVGRPGDGVIAAIRQGARQTAAIEKRRGDVDENVPPPRSRHD